MTWPETPRSELCAERKDSISAARIGIESIEAERDLAKHQLHERAPLEVTAIVDVLRALPDESDAQPVRRLPSHFTPRVKIAVAAVAEVVDILGLDVAVDVAIGDAGFDARNNPA